MKLSKPILTRGDRVPGSRLYRNFCPGCGTDMRVNVVKDDDGKYHLVEAWCVECTYHNPTGGMSECFDDEEYDIDAFAPCWKYGN